MVERGGDLRIIGSDGCRVFAGRAGCGRVVIGGIALELRDGKGGLA